MVAAAGGLARTRVATLGNGDLAEIAARLYALLSADDSLEAAFGASHHREDLRALEALQLLPAAA
jgi:hypothetical protein